MLLWCTKRIFGCIQRARDECDAMNKKYTWTYTRGAYKYILGYMYKRCMLLHFVHSIRSLVFTYLHVYIFKVACRCQGSTRCSILPSRMGEHGVSSENMDKMENMILGQLKMEKHQPKCRALADAMQSFLYLNINYT